uniref:type II secretion system protein GspN n=1 Tax=Candidatus Electrothrix sp. TaxID=2170559 RepID=UPI004056A524
ILQAGVDRKISGVLSGKGSVIFEKSPLAIAEAKGDVSIVRGEFELEQQILGLNVLRLQENSFSIKINQSTVEITQGKIKNSEINVDFQGNIQINKPLIASDINLSGSILPKTELFQKQPQVRDIVVRLQKRFKGDTLPFKVDGFIGQPTFVFQ